MLSLDVNEWKVLGGSALVKKSTSWDCDLTGSNLKKWKGLGILK